MSACLLNCVGQADAGPDWVSYLSVLGLLLTALSAAVAALSYLASRRAAADSHMHMLFREYLKQRIDREVIAARDDVDMTRIDREMRSSKHYALEEMYGWLASQWPWGLWAPFVSRRRKEALIAWKNTIASHLRRDELSDDFSMTADCYGRDFLEFAGNLSGSTTLTDVAKARRWKWRALNDWDGLPAPAAAAVAKRAAAGPPSPSKKAPDKPPKAS